MLLPFGKREGIVINLAEFRLYYYPKGEKLVYVFPVGIGMRASSDRIRLYDDDIEWLYNNIAKGTSIRILEQAIKMSYEHDGKKIELHSPLTPNDGSEAKLIMTNAVKNFIGDNDETLK